MGRFDFQVSCGSKKRGMGGFVDILMLDRVIIGLSYKIELIEVRVLELDVARKMSAQIGKVVLDSE